MAGCWRTRRFLFPLEEGAKGIPGIAWAKARQPESQAALVASQAAPSGCRGACGLVPVPLSSASEATFPECFLLSMFSFMTDVILTQRKPGWAALHPEYPQDPLPPSQNTRAFTVLTPGVPHKSQTAAVQGRCAATAAASAGDPEVPEAPRCSDALGGRCSRLLGPWLRRGSELPPPGCQSVPGHVCLSGRLSLSRAAHRGPPAVPRSAFRAAPRGGPSATLGPTSEAGTFSRSSAPASLSFCHSAPPAASLGQRRASAGRAREAAAPSPSSVCVPCLSLPLSACRSPRLQLSNCSHLSAALSLSVPP